MGLAYQLCSPLIFYQSYHRGIEIQYAIPLSSDCLYYQSYHRGIEIDNLTSLRYFADTINRTIVELKYLCVLVCGIVDCLSIVPSWNWNEKLKLRPPLHHLLSIVPSWNWNYWNSINEGINHFLSIVPSWNWNEILKLGPPLHHLYQSYHRGIEISKQVHFLPVPLTLSIVPSWNWNV